MSGGLDLEQRYRRVLRLLPGYYRDAWEEDMVAAFLDGWLTGDPDEDSVTMEYDRPSRAEIASVAALAARLYLGGVGAPRRYFAWGQAVRGAVLAVLLLHAVLGLDGLMVMAGSRQLAGYLPAPFSSIWTWVRHVAYCTWILIFAALVLGYYRAARVIAALAIIPDLAGTLHAQLTGTIQSPYFSWAFCVLLDLAPVLALTAFHRDAPPLARRPWLLALPAAFVLVVGPLPAARPAPLSAWLPDFPGLCCILVTLACLARAPRAWSGRAAPGAWSLTLVLLAAVAGMFRIASLGDYAYGYVYAPHLIGVGLAELLILAAAVALVAPDAARAQTAVPVQGPPPPATCPAGYAALPAGGQPPGSAGCYRKLGPPATFTTAAVTVFRQPAGPHGQPARYVLRITVPAAGAAALTAITTNAAGTQEQLAVIIAGQARGAFVTPKPLTSGEFEIPVQSLNQALQLQRTMLQPA